MTKKSFLEATGSALAIIVGALLIVNRKEQLEAIFFSIGVLSLVGGVVFVELAPLEKFKLIKILDCVMVVMFAVVIILISAQLAPK